eukprot:1137452-Pelagomonas_calceolata.AAC.2
MVIRRVSGTSPCLILLMRIGRSLFKSAPRASKFMSILDTMSLKLQRKLGGLICVKTKLFKGLRSERGIDAPAHT